MVVSLIANNYNSGQLGDSASGRFDLKQYNSGLAFDQNWIPFFQGGLLFRPGSEHINRTRRRKIDRKANFVFSETDSLTLSFTEGYLRFYDNDGQVLETAKTITGITAANPAVVTCNSHGYNNGDEIYITGVVGMPELNGKFFTVANVTTHTFELKDIMYVDDIDASGYTAYTSGGTCARVYEITSPYLEEDIFKLKFAQRGNEVRIVDGYNPPYKLTRTTNTSWTLAQFTRTNDPFARVITGATKANPCVITASSHGYATGDEVYLKDIAGMTELNNAWYTITVINTNTFSLNGVNSTGYTTYTSGGLALNSKDQPKAIGLYRGSLWYGGTVYDRDYFWGSRKPTDAGELRYDDFTTGTDDDHAVVFPVQSINNTADDIRFFAGTPKFLLIGSLAGTYKATGGADGTAITPLQVSVNPVDFLGCADVQPVMINSTIFYVQRGGRKLATFEYDLYADGYLSVDKNILTDDMLDGQIIQLAAQRGFVNIVWCVTDTGKLYGLVYDQKEGISGWFEFKTEGKILTVSVEVNQEGQDVLWFTREIVIDSITERYTEKMSIDLSFIKLENLYTGDSDADKLKQQKLEYEVQRRLNRTDSSLSYDGTQNTTLTLSDTDGEVTVTAGAAMFSESDIGRQIMVKYLTGDEDGIGEIIGHTSTTEVTMKIIRPFDKTSYAANTWYLSTNTLSGLTHLEGKTVYYLGDGGEGTPTTVANGEITLDGQYGYVIVGLRYIGIAKFMPLVIQDNSGLRQVITKTINQIGFKVLSSLSFKYGTDLYKLKTCDLTYSDKEVMFPDPLVSKPVLVPAYDGYDTEKSLFIVQDKTLPVKIVSVNMYAENTEE